MNNPVETFLLAAALAGIAVIFFMPQKGLLARRRISKRNNQRVLIEDALKHLYDCEYTNRSCTFSSIAGSLSITVDQAARLAERLENMGLLISADNELHLTTAGKSYALRVIRIHRLWERYLADETGTDEMYWHKDAEDKEHLLSVEEADALSAQMGNPVFDPHGDPIPTSDGKLPQIKGRLLSSLQPGETAQIIHIEDEPDAVYAQIVAQGLYPGVHIRMIGVEKERITFEANGDEVILAPVFASNISVAEIPESEKGIEKFKRLSSLRKGEEAAVVGISKACRGQQRRRLMDLGIIPGTKIKAELISAGGDPVAYNIRGALVALRKQQSNLIFINDILQENVNPSDENKQHEPKKLETSREEV